MAVIDETKSLFEHIRNRLPTGYGLGDDETVYKDNVPDHAVFQQSLREDHEGDVGIFETLTSDFSIMGGAIGYESKIQFAVVTKNGDIDSAVKYFKEALNNIKTNCKSTGCYIKNCKLVNIMPVGKNSVGLQMVTMNISIKYVLFN